MGKKINITSAEAFEALVRTELPRLLEQWSEQAVREVVANPMVQVDGAVREVDLVLEWAGQRVLVEVKSGASAAQVEGAIRHLKYLSVGDEHDSTLLAVSHMGEVGAQRCAAAGLNWADLSGNAEIRLGGIHIHRRGEPNRFTLGSSRPNPFSTKASRIPRALLMAPQRWWSQEELIPKTDLSRGYVSRVVSELERLDLVVRDEEYRVRSRDPSVLLEGWREEYSPRAGIEIPGHVAARTGEQLAEVVSRALSEADVKYYLTALAAAWRYAPSARFRNVHAYVRRRPSVEVCDELGFREGHKGANLFFILTEDEAVWAGAKPMNGASCVSPLQAYLDLKGLGERSAEAGRDLRHHWLNWTSSG